MYKLRIVQSGKEYDYEPGASLLEILLAQNIFIDNPCNGKGICGKCKVKILSGDAGKVTETERRFLSEEELARGIRLSGPALGRPKKGEDRNKAQDYRDECERVEVERKFSLGKRKCGMGLVTAKLEETAAHVVALSILLLNLRKIQCAFLQFLDWLLGLLQSREKRMVIQ